MRDLDPSELWHETFEIDGHKFTACPISHPYGWQLYDEVQQLTIRNPADPYGLYPSKKAAKKAAREYMERKEKL